MNKKYAGLIIYLGLVVITGFSGVYFDKYNFKEKFINFRHSLYNYFTRDPIQNYTLKDNKNIVARFLSESRYIKKTRDFDNLKQYPPQRNLPAVTNYCHGFLNYGNPSFDINNGLGQANLYLCRDGYVVGYNYQTKQASWVAFRLTQSKVANKHKRKDSFNEDKDIPFVYRAQLSDYKNSGYDRGHLASYASVDFSKNSAQQSFLLSNISPQKASLNRKGWEILETYERIWTNMYDSLYVYIGPVYKKQKIHQTIGDNKIAVPDYFFKIIYVPTKNKAIAFVMPNVRVSKSKVKNYRTSIKDIESRTGLHFLSNIPDRENIVNNVSSMWRTSYF